MTSDARDITQQATQDLSEFSLDFRGLTVTGVTIDGVAATFTRDVTHGQADHHAGRRDRQRPHVPHGRRLQRRAGPDPGPGRLVRGLAADARRRLRGQRADGRDGLVPEQQPPSRQGDLRLPHHGPVDARRARQRRAASRRSTTPNGTTTWNWHHGYPMATYLTTATVGLFDYTQDAPARPRSAPAGNPLELYNAFESSLHRRRRRRRTANARRRARTQIVKFLADYNGVAYPFDSIGAVVDRARPASATCSRCRRRSTSRPAAISRQHARARDRAPVVRRQRRR